MSRTSFERAIEMATGESIDRLRRTPLDERRHALEQARGEPLCVRSYFPLIGRGNVMRDRVVPHEDVEESFREAIGGRDKA